MKRYFVFAVIWQRVHENKIDGNADKKCVQHGHVLFFPQAFKFCREDVSVTGVGNLAG